MTTATRRPARGAATDERRRSRRDVAPRPRRCVAARRGARTACRDRGARRRRATSCASSSRRYGWRAYALPVLRRRHRRRAADHAPGRARDDRPEPAPATARPAPTADGQSAPPVAATSIPLKNDDAGSRRRQHRAQGRGAARRRRRTRSRATARSGCCKGSSPVVGTGQLLPLQHRGRERHRRRRPRRSSRTLVADDARPTRAAGPARRLAAAGRLRARSTSTSR